MGSEMCIRDRSSANSAYLKTCSSLYMSHTCSLPPGAVPPRNLFWPGRPRSVRSSGGMARSGAVRKSAPSALHVGPRSELPRMGEEEPSKVGTLLFQALAHAGLRTRLDGRKPRRLLSLVVRSPHEGRSLRDARIRCTHFCTAFMVGLQLDKGIVESPQSLFQSLLARGRSHLPESGFP